MRYKNAQEVLPDKLLKELQKYVSGETLYIPQAGAKKDWGENSGARIYYKQRNEQIRGAYISGKSIVELALSFNLSVDSIRKIIL